MNKSKLHISYKNILSWLWLFGCFLFLLLFLNRHMIHLVDSDMASELILAKNMADNGNLLFSHHWIYSSELRVLNTQLIFSNLFRLTDSWQLVRFAGNAVLYILLLLCFRFFCCQIGLKQAFPILGGCLLLPVSVEYFDFVLKGVFYIPHICISFLVLGLLFRLIRKDKKTLQVFDCLWLILLSFAAGLGGLRQLFILYCPLLLASAFTLYAPAKNILCAPGADCRKLIAEELTANRYARFFAASFAATVFALAGYLINSKILSRFIHFADFSSIHWTEFSSERFWSIVNGWLKNFGYRPGKELFSAATICNIGSVLCLLLLILFILRSIRQKKSLNFETVILMVFGLTAAVLFTVFYSVTDMEYQDRYNLPIAVFAIPMLAVGLKQLPFSVFWKRTTAVLLCGICLLSGICNYQHFSKVMRLRADEEKAVADFLVANGYYNGYASFWNANILTEFSNGQIEVWVDDSPDDLSDIGSWLQKAEHHVTLPEGKIFIVAQDYEKNGDSLYARLNNEDLIFQTAVLSVYGYENYEAIPEELKPAE